MLLTGEQYRESLRSYSPNVYVKGQKVESVVDSPWFQPGINAIGVTYDYALDEEHRHLATAANGEADRRINRFLHITRSSDDLLAKLEYVRLVCQETGCAMRYLTMDGLNALHQVTWRIDDDKGTDYHPRLLEYIEHVQDKDLTVAIAMTDAKGDRSRRPHQQANANSYVHVVERRADGIVISGTKAIVTSGPYVHELFVLPGRAMSGDDVDFAVGCAVPVDADGLTMVARPAGRPGESGAHFSNKYGQSTAVCVFDKVFVPWERVFLCGEWEHSEYLTKAYANHHRHTCIGARAGFGDLLIGAGALMVEANGLDPDRQTHLREEFVELIKIVEGFYACGVAASVFPMQDPSGNVEPDAVYANIGKLLMAHQIYDMHRVANNVSGGLVATLPVPEDDHNPVSGVDMSELLGGRPDIPYDKRARIARFMEDLTVSSTAGWYSTISVHGGGSPEAMKREIFRRYPIPERKRLVERLMNRGAAAD
ncbi:MAG TPA: 4-hydroxyphenylacetate 3-hydroxylase N-terminal domain-containing protein, partial [Arenicellales bacterium]|nr:4-hydroxyphenylacetate 3-hydroxylase N-terminal domain-containing protein [Arenicellales bacterium]